MGTGEERTRLEVLQEPDETTLLFGPFGIGARVDPRVAADLQHLAIQHAVLHEDVDEDVRALFKRVRRLHEYGVLEYEFFTAAIDQASLLLETALRRRFFEYYGEREATLVRGPDTHSRRFSTQKQVKRLAERGWHLRCSDGAEEELPRSLGALLGWARREKLLPGRRTRRVDRTMVYFRHQAAHPKGYTLQIPPDSARHINDLAEFINRLWGHNTPGGSLFPGPIARQVRAAAISSDGDFSMSHLNLAELAAVEGDAEGYKFGLFRAAVQEDLTTWGFTADTGLRFSYTDGFETTQYPCECLYRGSLKGLQALLRSDEVDLTSDHPEYLDRTFVIGESSGDVDQPRSWEQFGALSSEERGSRRWHVIVADGPYDARVHVQHHREAELHADGTCSECFVLVREVLDPASEQSGEGL